MYKKDKNMRLNRFEIYLFISIICFISLSTNIIYAENKPALTLQQCISLAEQHSSELKIQAEKLFQAAQQLKQAQGLMLPDIRYQYSTFNQDTAGGALPAQGRDSKFVFNQPLFSGFKKADTASFSKSVIKEEELQYKTVNRNITAVVTQAFYNLLQIETDAANINNTYNLLQDRLKELNERVRLGKSRESEVLAVESQMAVLRAQEENTEGERQKALEDLSFLTGVAADDITVFDDTPAVEKLDPIEKYLQTIQYRPDIEALRQGLESQKYLVKIAKGDFWPSLNLSGSWYTARSGSQSDSNWQTLLLLDFPLFEGGFTKAGVNVATSRLRQAEENLSFLTQQVTTEIRQLHKALASSLAQAVLLKDAYDKAAKSYQMQLKDYRYGLVTNLDVLQSMTTMLDVKRTLDSALVQLKINKALLDIVTMQ
jgi:outer membrane protein